jgi:hypothetical protein
VTEVSGGRSGVSVLEFASLEDERSVGFGVVHRLALLKPLIEFVGEGVDSGFFLMLVAMDRKDFRSLPALHGAHFAAKIRGNLFPGNQFPVRKG